mgnify:FL=1
MKKVILFKRIVIFFLVIFNFSQGKKIKDDDIKSFIISKYEGDTSTVSNLLTEEFIYNHPPMVGLGVDVVYKEGSFEILKILRRDSLNFFSIGDKIEEINNQKVLANTELPIGPIGSIHKLILNKKNDSTFIEIEVPLIEFSYKEPKLSFINSINLYSKKWYDFDIKFLDIIHRKNKAFVYYRWEGSKIKGGPVYIFYAMELLVYNKKNEAIDNIKTLWTNDIFMKQFLH